MNETSTMKFYGTAPFMLYHMCLRRGLLLTTIRKARNHRDEDHCQYHLGIDHCQIGNRCQDREHFQNGNEHADDHDQWSALKYN